MLQVQSIFSSPPLCLFFDIKDLLNETVEGPTLWSVTTLNGEQELDRTETKLKGSTEKEVVDGDSDGASSLRVNLTVVNSTFNYTMTQEVRTFYSEVCHAMLSILNVYTEFV